jgi:hypothetical protein
MPKGVEQKLPPGPPDLRWLRSGRLHGVRIGGPRAGWRISESEVERLLETARRDRPSGHDTG